MNIEKKRHFHAFLFGLPIDLNNQISITLLLF